MTPAEFDECLSLLGRARLVQRSDGGRLLLGRNLAQVDLDGLMTVLGLRLNASIAWPETARRVLEAMEAALQPYSSASLASLLDTPDLLESPARLRPVEHRTPLLLDTEEAGSGD